jgi:hypothetical protein
MRVTEEQIAQNRPEKDQPACRYSGVRARSAFASQREKGEENQMAEKILKLENGEFRKVDEVWRRYWSDGSSSNLDTENFRDVFRLLENALEATQSRPGEREKIAWEQGIRHALEYSGHSEEAVNKVLSDLPYRPELFMGTTGAGTDERH